MVKACNKDGGGGDGAGNGVAPKPLIKGDLRVRRMTIVASLPKPVLLLVIRSHLPVPLFVTGASSTVLLEWPEPRRSFPRRSLS
jgi:hypothetical protein